MTAPLRLDHGRLLDVLGVEGELLANSASGAAARRTVPGCPGLTVGDTVRHVGAEYRTASRWIRGGKRPRAPADTPATTSTGPGEGAGGQLVADADVDELRAALAEVRSELASRDPAQTCRTWWPADQTCGFFGRRLAHESTVHRVDVQAALAQRVRPIPADVAVDGIDEVLRLWFGFRLGELGIVGTHRAVVAVHAGGHEWITRAGPDGTAVLPAGSVDVGNVDAVVSGSPSGMYLWLWGRVPDRVVVVDGDHDATAQLWALLRLATR